MDRNTVCDSCILKEKCVYMLIFNPIGINPAKRLQNMPHGFVLKPPLKKKTIYLPDKPLSFGMILVGDRINYLPYVIAPVIELGESGSGEDAVFRNVWYRIER